MLKEKRPHHGLSRQKSAPVLRFFALLRRSFVQLPIWLRAVLNIGCFNARQPFAVHFVRPGPAEAASEQSAPAGLFGEVQRYATGELQFTDMHLRYLGMNETLSRMAADLVRRYKPNILTIHLPCTDEVQHREWREGGRCA
ncbi:hypothetical protein [Chitinophaga sp.]|uniref:hypothetical protein n=1 Tax=Chitinophaga sp. TaxID=1869181 RepID=UPI002C7DB4BD|nr:hypothetical protein [Chitinophaga sp.]HWV68146.1 hypothetical protein [Chitinophaga sp.]